MHHVGAVRLQIVHPHVPPTDEGGEALCGGLLGGFLTPVLINTGHDNPLGLFGYAWSRQRGYEQVQKQAAEAAKTAKKPWKFAA
mgnify:CR=1 FL=1